MYSLIAKWTILEGCEDLAWAALKELAIEVKLKEPKTLMYLIYEPDMSESSLPTPCRLEVTFHEVYEDKQAFLDHIKGPVFTNFVKKHMNLFLTSTATNAAGESVTSPFVTFTALDEKAGYIRESLVSHTE